MPNTYGFRIKSCIPHTRNLEGESRLEFSVGKVGHQVSLSVPKRKDGTEKSEVILLGRQFSDKAEAEKVGQRLKEAAVLASLSVDLGIDIGQDTPAEGAFGLSFYVGDKKVTRTKSISYNNLEGDTIMIDDVHGLVVHPDRKKVLCWSFNISEPITPVSTEKFVAEIQKYYSLDRRLSDRQKLALELFTSSYYESSARARFLTLTSVVEVLTESDVLSDRACDLLDGMLSDVENSDLIDSERQDLKNRLGYLKRESISRACQNLLERRLGKNGKEAIRKYYGLRSKMVHKGVIANDVDFVDVVRSLEVIVSGLLKAEIFDLTLDVKFKGDDVPGLA